MHDDVGKTLLNGTADVLLRSLDVDADPSIGREAFLKGRNAFRLCACHDGFRFAYSDGSDRLGGNTALDQILRNRVRSLFR